MVQHKSWGTTGFCAGSSFCFYINGLVDDLSSDVELFAEDTSLFTIVYDENIAAGQLNNDLIIVSQWAYQ